MAAANAGRVHNVTANASSWRSHSHPLCHADATA